MEIRRTANAGVLLKLDGVTILLDGVCREVEPYPATPPEERALICACFPHVVCFTHAHKDHFDPTFAKRYQEQTGRVILGPEDLPGCRSSMQAHRWEGVTVTPIPSRHIGIAGKTVSHASFVIEGRKCLWFLGDSSPLLWKDRQDLPRPDVLLVPYAYTTTPTGWAVVRSLQPQSVILLHMPERARDTIGLWDATERTVGQLSDLYIPAMGEKIFFE